MTSHTLAHVLTQACPIACPSEVVFVKCKATGRVFAWCPHCQVAWFDPANETWELGDTGHSCIVDPGEYAPQGIVLATRDEIDRAAMASLITDTEPARELLLSEIAKLNSRSE